MKNVLDNCFFVIVPDIGKVRDLDRLLRIAFLAHQSADYADDFEWRMAEDKSQFKRLVQLEHLLGCKFDSGSADLY